MDVYLHEGGGFRRRVEMLRDGGAKTKDERRKTGPRPAETAGWRKVETRGGLVGEFGL